MKRLSGKTEVEDALQRLDKLTQEENLMTVARTFEARHDAFTRSQSRSALRLWLDPPNPSINHNNACGTRHDGTAEWFIRGSTFDEWKTDGSLLWICGYRMLLLLCRTCMIANGLSGFSAGSGKSILWYVVT